MIKDVYSGFVTGRALDKFERKEYEEAARLIEQVLGYGLKGTNVKYLKSVLGRCYLGMGKVGEATATLLESYSKYKEAELVFESEYERYEYRQLLEALSAALAKAGRGVEAAAVVGEVKGLRCLRS